nr:hypothetical protein [uncultured Cohaesibacter sp.]
MQEWTMNDMSEQHQVEDVNRLIYWSAGILAAIGVVGLIIWSRVGIAVFYDRISGAIANCF